MTATKYLERQLPPSQHSEQPGQLKELTLHRGHLTAVPVKASPTDSATFRVTGAGGEEEEQSSDPETDSSAERSDDSDDSDGSGDTSDDVDDDKDDDSFFLIRPSTITKIIGECANFCTCCATNSNNITASKNKIRTGGSDSYVLLSCNICKKKKKIRTSNYVLINKVPKGHPNFDPSNEKGPTKKKVLQNSAEFAMHCVSDCISCIKHYWTDFFKGKKYECWFGKCPIFNIYAFISDCNCLIDCACR